MADTITNIIGKNIRLSDNGDGTYSLSVRLTDTDAINIGDVEVLSMPPVTDIVSGVATSGSKVRITDTTKDFPVNMLAGMIAEIEIDGVTYYRKVVSNTANAITISTLPGTAASAIIGTGDNGVVTITSDIEEDDENNTTVQVVEVATENASLAAELTDEHTLVISLGNDSGDKASTTIGSGADGVVTIEVDVAGSAGNDYTIAVNADLDTQDRALSSTLVANDLIILLATEGNAKAAAAIGTGENGTVNIEVDVAGSSGNDYTVEVVAGDGALGAVLTVKTLVVTLAAGGSTATDIAAAINVAYGATLTATASGTGADSLTLAEAAKDFEGGTNKLKTASNTATLVANRINGTHGATLTATASGTGNTAISAAVAETNFTGGGENVATDNAKNTATLVAGVVHALAGLTAVANGTGASVVAAMAEPLAFSGGIDLVVVGTGDSYAIKSNKILVNADGSINAATTMVDGGSATLGLKADAAVTNPASSASLIAATKGLLTYLGTTGLISKVTDVTFHDAATVTANGTALVVGSGKTLLVEVYGSETNTARTVTFYGKGPAGVLRAIQGVKLSNFSVASSTTGTGELWRFDISGLTNVIMDLTAITGGSVTVKGKVVA